MRLRKVETVLERQTRVLKADHGRRPKKEAEPNTKDTVGLETGLPSNAQSEGGIQGTTRVLPK